jgi:hypothetical protein
MVIIDKSGRVLRAGQLVDIPMNGMFTGNIMEVIEPTITISGRPPAAPSVIVQILINMPVNPRNGVCDNLYLVKDAPKSELDPTGITGTNLGPRREG